MNKLICIVGPTGVGKTKLSIELAKRLNGEVINADSTQVYRGLDIATAKVTEEEKEGIPHHLFDIKDITEDYTVYDYQKDCRLKIDEITKKGKTPIIVGGTGLYINALINGMNFSDADRSDEVREKWKAIAQEKGNEYVYSKLVEVDAESAQKISPNDLKRTIRALEIYEVTGKPKSQSANTS
jgi:tRNA dimethylallyltransferase